MSLLPWLCRARDHRGLDGDQEAGGDRRRTRSRAGAQRRMAEARPPPRRGPAFLPREEWANRGPRGACPAGCEPRGRKSSRRRCGSGDRGAAVLGPDHAMRGRVAATPNTPSGTVLADIAAPEQEARDAERSKRNPGAEKAVFPVSRRRRACRRRRLSTVSTAAALGATSGRDARPAAIMLDDGVPARCPTALSARPIGGLAFRICGCQRRPGRTRR